MTLRINDAFKNEFSATTRDRPSGNDTAFDLMIATANAQSLSSGSASPSSEGAAGLAKIDVDGGAMPFAQTLGQLMDDHGNRNGKVDNIEFGDFETAFVHAEELNQTSKS